MKTMRQSRQSSVLSTTDKSKYPRCQRKKQHQKESLNLVCLTPTCKNRGLICVMCKSQHTGHIVQPVKTFLTRLEESLKKIELSRAPKIQQNSSMISQELSIQGVLQRLEEQHIEMLSLLKIQIEEIAQKVRVCQEEVMKEYNRIKDKVQNEFEKETLIGQILADIQKYFGQIERQDTLDLRFNVAKLLTLLKIDKTEISVLNEAEKDLNGYTLSAKTFKNNMLVWQRETSNIITEVFKAKAEYQMRETISRPMTAGDPSAKTPTIAFSSQFKTESVVIDKEGKNARVKDDKNGKVILLNQSVLEHKNNTVKFKITGIGAGSTIILGLCMKPQVSQKQYKFQKTAAHGLFVLSSNGFIYSSGDNTINNTKSLLTFKANEEIWLEVDAKENKLIIAKKKNDNKVTEISLKHLSEIDWKELYFCVGMNSVGDKVQLLS